MQSSSAQPGPIGILFDIQFRRHIDLVRDILTVLFALPHALRQQIFDLPVHRAEVIFGPGGKGIVEKVQIIFIHTQEINK